MKDYPNGTIIAAIITAVFFGSVHFMNFFGNRYQTSYIFLQVSRPPNFLNSRLAGINSPIADLFGHPVWHLLLSSLHPHQVFVRADHPSRC